MKEKAIEWTFPPLDHKKPLLAQKEDGTIDPASEWWKGAQIVLRREHNKLIKEKTPNNTPPHGQADPAKG